MRPRFGRTFRPRNTEGVGNAGCPMHPRPRVHFVLVERTRVTTSTPESPGIPARNGFNGFLRALPGDRAVLPPSLTDCSANLTPASGRQDHTTSPSASASFVRALRAPDAAASTASRSYVRDDRETPLCVGRDVGSCRDDLGLRGSGIFLRRGMDRLMGDLPVGQDRMQAATESRLRCALVRTAISPSELLSPGALLHMSCRSLCEGVRGPAGPEDVRNPDQCADHGGDDLTALFRLEC
jgi:hypothetical protein